MLRDRSTGPSITRGAFDPRLRPHARMGVPDPRSRHLPIRGAWAAYLLRQPARKAQVHCADLDGLPIARLDHRTIGTKQDLAVRRDDIELRLSRVVQPENEIFQLDQARADRKPVATDDPDFSAGKSDGTRSRHARGQGGRCDPKAIEARTRRPGGIDRFGNAHTKVTEQLAIPMHQKLYILPRRFQRSRQFARSRPCHAIVGHPRTEDRQAQHQLQFPPTHFVPLHAPTPRWNGSRERFRQRHPILRNP
ncbi:hypothetical protein EV148_11028 [Dokdonella fugitiva]|uniref:Uncharacterized protein n=1 Tax=Dokdonella fugitiva TaxID=328517 RepID=A0A4R2I0G6_9GAMM|nr:hypothetical protein EV148_11028 [Dokdonella fugitiva]